MVLLRSVRNMPIIDFKHQGTDYGVLGIFQANISKNSPYDYLYTSHKKR